ncbi:aminopeptidase P family protein [Aspergillus clavatus NRRL 1]|uniref:Probable Xaa-Pro aminopeptidase ACLA_020440 n=1 Tax=Aspergillus clavatus (strain ATCC 1007 / CBS 513.65 / DSM 816 / NCTC 3887 / NRRL 1 / QM 1276 / 107) TaxID=344612 RepID=AMPP2_ASPCL|nr:peptidase D, putative [Aspergillus clavatus NRRL 1]A1CNW6.1 RecName: Full=Probable Xaa-Pro aminopeptidase ACLA_020440; AltName: Full=Aminoacylproline aminopeptidase; AltName: Full=Prolidase [Aspergillus clavatus NRRL 1]EAW07337.1 peptidase D, putative [Aspergillus clavatus NRRL 1]
MRDMGRSDIVISAVDALDIHIAMTSNACDKYPAKQHARRVAVKLGVSTGLVYLAGQPTVNWGDSDQPRPFRQRRYFYYLSGVDEADCYVTYDIRNDLLTLYVPDFDLHRAVWMGPTLTVEEARERYDVDQVRYYASLQGDVQRWVDKYNQSSPLYILHDTQRPRVSSNEVRFDDESLLPAMDATRGVKDEHEIRMIREANRISGLAHRRVLENIHRMSNEAEIEGLFLNTCISHRAKNQAYELIAGSGENAAVLHYVKNNEPLRGRQLVCLDAGAEWNCYASDVTRTFPLGTDWPSAEARHIYQLVEEMQEECIKRIQKGVRFIDLQVLAHVIAIEGLMRLGILRGGSVEEIRESGASTVFFPHGLGHHVGLEVHDVSAKDLRASDADRDYYNSVLTPSTSHGPCTLSAPALEEGMVVTVEPGIYFSRLALANARKLPYAKYIDFNEAEKYIPIGGVRIEDDILVTSSGYENLTTAPKGEAMLEIIRRGIDN